MTIKDNILFGECEQEKWYQNVVSSFVVRVNLINYVHYIKILNPVIFFLIVALYLVEEVLMVGCNLVLVKWTNEVAISSFSLSKQSKYMEYYGVFIAEMFVCSMDILHNGQSFYQDVCFPNK